MKEKATLAKDLVEFVEKAQKMDNSTNPLLDCIQELKGILLKHLEPSKSKMYENVR